MHRHVYYGCTKVRDRDCKCGYINEDELIRQFEKLIDNVEIDEIGMKEKIKTEIARFERFQQFVLGIKEKPMITDIDVRNYAKYVLKEGAILEKRELLALLKNRICLKQKVISLQKRS